MQSWADDVEDVDDGWSVVPSVGDEVTLRNKAGKFRVVRVDGKRMKAQVSDMFNPALAPKRIPFHAIKHSTR